MSSTLLRPANGRQHALGENASSADRGLCVMVHWRHGWLRTPHRLPLYLEYPAMFDQLCDSLRDHAINPDLCHIAVEETVKCLINSDDESLLQVARLDRRYRSERVLHVRLYRSMFVVLHNL